MGKIYKNKKPTIKDIAKKTGFSHATVSRVLNKKGKFYSRETAKHIEEVAKKLNYTPNAMARYLKERSTKNIAYLIPESHSFYFSIYDGMKEVANKNGYNLMVMISDYDKDKEESNIRTLIENRVDGVIVASMMVNKRQISVLRDNNLPIVLVDREENYKNVSKVIINNERLAFLGTSHLIEQGHREIAYISGPLRMLNYHKRFLGYKRALADNKIEYKDSLVFLMSEPDWLVTYKRDYEMIRNIITNNRKITALFIISAALPIIAVKAIRDFGLNIPEDIAILGFNEIPLSKYIVPPISSIVLPTKEIGSKAMDILLRMINDDKYKEVLELEERLVIRESTVAK